jgi:hypothetical protein
MLRFAGDDGHPQQRGGLGGESAEDPALPNGARRRRAARQAAGSEVPRQQERMNRDIGAPLIPRSAGSLHMRILSITTGTLAALVVCSH